MDQQYNKIMGFITENNSKDGEEENVLYAGDLSDEQKFPDIRDIFELNDHETGSNDCDVMENVEFLEEDEEAVMEHLRRHRNMEGNIQKNYKATNVKDVNNLVIPLRENENAAESIISLIRSMNENHSLKNKTKICTDITKLFNFIITEVENPMKRNSKLQFILE